MDSWFNPGTFVQRQTDQPGIWTQSTRSTFHYLHINTTKAPHPDQSKFHTMTNTNNTSRQLTPNFTPWPLQTIHPDHPKLQILAKPNYTARPTQNTLPDYNKIHTLTTSNYTPWYPKQHLLITQTLLPGQHKLYTLIIQHLEHSKVHLVTISNYTDFWPQITHPDTPDYRLWPLNNSLHYHWPTQTTYPDHPKIHSLTPPNYKPWPCQTIHPLSKS